MFYVDDHSFRNNLEHEKKERIYRGVHKGDVKANLEHDDDHAGGYLYDHW